MDSFWDFFWLLLWFFFLSMWIFFVIQCAVDLFRDKSTSGWAKAGWVIFFIFLPFLAVLIYIIARGKGMSERQMAQQQAAKQEFDTYVKETAATAQSPTEQIASAKTLLDQGAITQEEYDQLKAQALA